MISEQQAGEVIGAQLIDSEGNKIGRVGQLFLDDQTGRPEWICVNTGLFGSKETFVPIADATVSGGEVRVPYAKSQIKDAPSIDVEGHLDERQEDELYRHYGLSNDMSSGTGTDTGLGADTGFSSRSETDVDSGLTGAGMGAGLPHDTRSGVPTGTSRGAGQDTSGPNTDDAMTRSEERVSAGTEKTTAGRAKLRKWVETENVQMDVPVKKEKARLVTEPITDANRGDAMDGPALSDEEHEVTLTEERAVVNKETVPVERVRMEKETQTDTETVTEQVGKERIEAEGDVVDLTKSQQRDRSK